MAKNNGTKEVKGTKEVEVKMVQEGKVEEKMGLTKEQMESTVKVILEDGDTSKSAKMKALYNLGLAVKEIAVLLDVRYNFVYNVISNHCIVSGIELTHTKKESKKDKVWAMFDEGKTVKEVAVDLKSNYQYIYKLHKEWKDQAVKEVAKMEAKDEIAVTGTEGGK